MSQPEDQSVQNNVPGRGAGQHFRIPFPDKEISGDLLFEGRPLNGDRMLEHFDPEFVAAYKAFVVGFFNATSLDPTLRELAIIRVGHLSECPYEVHHHESFARNLGVPETKIAAMANAAPEGLTESEEAVINFVDELVRSARPSDAVLKAVRNHFGDKEVLELVMVVGNWMMGARFIETVGMPIEDFAIQSR